MPRDHTDQLLDEIFGGLVCIGEADGALAAVGVFDPRAGQVDQQVHRLPLARILNQPMQAFYCCIVCITVIDAEEIDRSRSTYALS
jgi:hypothetical protein